MIATDANVSRILIARQADSYLAGNIAAWGGGWGSRGWGVVGRRTARRLSPTQVSLNFFPSEKDIPKSLLSPSGKNTIRKYC